MKHTSRSRVDGVISIVRLITSNNDFLLKAQREGVAAKAFFKKALSNNGKPDKITLDKSGSNIHAINALNESYPEDEKIEMRQIKYLNNIVEQDHRFIKKRVHPMLKAFIPQKKL